MIFFTDSWRGDYKRDLDCLLKQNNNRSLYFYYITPLLKNGNVLFIITLLLSLFFEGKNHKYHYQKDSEGR